MSGYDKSLIIGKSNEDLDELLCGICQDVFNKPVVTQCCRQTYCKACIEEWLTTQKTCPNDRKSLRTDDLIPAPRLVINILDKLRIRCDFHDNGCQVITTIGDHSKHLQICEHKPELNCKTCGLVKADERHDCISNLVTRNKSISDELKILRRENMVLRRHQYEHQMTRPSFDFTGKFKLSSSENYETFLKEVELNQLSSKPINHNLIIEISKCGDTYIFKIIESRIKLKELRFELGKLFEDVGVRGERVDSVIVADGNKLIQSIFGHKLIKIVRELVGQQLIITMSVGSIFAIRVFNRIQS